MFSYVRHKYFSVLMSFLVVQVYILDIFSGIFFLRRHNMDPTYVELIVNLFCCRRQESIFQYKFTFEKGEKKNIEAMRFTWSFFSSYCLFIPAVWIIVLYYNVNCWLFRQFLAQWLNTTTTTTTTKKKYKVNKRKKAAATIEKYNIYM